MRKFSIALLLLGACASAPKPAPLALDHILVFVQPDTAGKAALERAGFRIAPGVNRHDGQGTASVTVEFQNSFLELIWPDESVAVAPELTAGAEKFRKRAAWRTSGSSPFGLALHRVGPVQLLPVQSWSIALPWMDPGTAIEILTPRGDSASPSISIHPHAVSENPELDVARRDLRAAGALDQPNGVRRITAIRLTKPENYTPAAALTYIESLGILKTDRGSEWTIELTFDDGAQRKEHDFRPTLPLRIRY